MSSTNHFALKEKYDTTRCECDEPLRAVLKMCRFWHHRWACPPRRMAAEKQRLLQSNVTINNDSPKGAIPHYSQSLYILPVNTLKINKITLIAGIYLFLLAWRDDRHARWKQYPAFEISIMGHCLISRDSEPTKMHHLRRFTCSLY